MDSLYQLNELKYSYLWNNDQVSVLKGLNLNFEKECFTCIVGPSGTGKTTLLNLLGLIDTPTQGEIFFCGENVTNLKEKYREELRLRKVGYVFQSFHLIPTLTALENTTYFLPSLGYNVAKMKKHSMEVLDLLGLADFANKKPLELSGGQRQRVAIARAIAKKPMVILADEPTANLDSETATKIIMAFKQLQAYEKTSFIFSTHDSHLVSFANKVHSMKDGLIVQGAK
jgi:ABC-type lipoprotein export system ATPase subunit